MQVHLSSLGCRLNEAELQNWAQSFQRIGYSLSNQVDKANLIVFNTCAVTAEAARKSRQMIRKYHRINPNARMVVTGCYASLEPQELEKIMGVDLVIDNHDKEALVDKVQEVLAVPVMPEFATEPGEAALFSRNRDRAFMKIQDGCRYRCTYCIVTVARGEERSRSLDELIDEVNQLHKDGVQEIVLAGVHVGGYGSDINSSLYQLVESILTQTQIPRIRFASVEPWDLGEGFFELFKNPRLMPHMHLPIQSGADSVLKRMSRRCRTSAFAELVNDARRYVPSFNVTTDVIVGFPGETEEEFQQTLDFVETQPFGHMHIFSYSDREGTKAVRLPNKIEKETKKLRSRQLHQLATKIKQQQLEAQLGTTASVLWESSSQMLDNGMQRFFGYTPNYHKVFVDLEPGYAIERAVLETELIAVSKDNQLVGKISAEQLSHYPPSVHKPKQEPILITQL
ncbi:tRNA (N(6)-L-threonylcarbamoyladenosine(37)-C(2))-methylthiotransferase MtaB [Kangiella sp. TOML190]|uniref:tRNA (N(6)-L-threonylcarbamoyladenosine(37)-C(2))- methylthiotransferase MtaB n=1 Tax=Kangiella sp. TOML190 TaxID=2931351 RepID=UPI00203A5FA1|nr:tRNA (N(6)-L-threonylcarbamoyladenosine(37)-C(2))-methylthiotransferase MtaB [Kangiella sp. TOML190]